MDKTGLRKIAKERVAQMTKEQRIAASSAIASRFLASSLFLNSKVIFCYVSVPTEPDTRMIINAALEAGKTVCVPRCYGKGRMDAVPVRSVSEIKGDSFYGIDQPDGRVPAMAPEKIDLVIVPCVAAGRKGERLGHGAGYYDRFLSSCRGDLVCLCFEDLIMDEIPMDEHDAFMRYIFTESNVFNCKK